jgi:hypothetical protein
LKLASLVAQTKGKVAPTNLLFNNKKNTTPALLSLHLSQEAMAKKLKKEE